METNLRALLVLDASGSMAYGRGAMSKLQYGAVCAGALAYLLARQGDQVGLIVAGDAEQGNTERLPAGVRSFLPFAASSAHVQEVLRRLDGAGLDLRSIELHRPSLDDVFLTKTGRSLRES
jgi:uncharacterized protein (DUF58 family)